MTEQPRVPIDSKVRPGPPAETSTAPSPPGAGGGLATARGRTTLSPRVVEKVVQRAASEVWGVEGVTGSGLRRLVELVRAAEPSREVDVQADVATESTVVDLTVSVRYPLPLRQVTDRVRQHVADRVGSLTGLKVPEVNVAVGELVPDRGGARSRRVE